MKNNFAKWKPYIFLTILLLSLIPLIWLGRYNYPTGDDYYYGAETHLVWQQTGSIIQTLDAACAGVADSYQIWQPECVMKTLSGTAFFRSSSISFV